MSDDGVGIELALSVEGDLRPVHFRVDEGASTLTHAVVEIATNEDVDFEPALGAEATLVLTIGGYTARRWTLCAGSVEFSRVEDGTLRYDVHLHPKLWLLGHTRDTRKFQGMSAKEIVAKVLSSHGVAHTFRLTREPKKRDYCVQYGESDLDFVSRLLEFEGIYYTFDEGGTMLLDDRSSAAEPVEGTSYFELLDAAGAMQKDERGIFSLRRVARVAPGRVTLNDFNWQTPKKKLLASEEATREQVLEVYEFPAGYRDEADGATLAKLRLEAFRARAGFVEGGGNVPVFAPGRSFSFGGNAGALFAGDYMISSASHEAHHAAFFKDGSGKKAPYKNGFRAIRLETPYRPEVVTPRPTIAGCHTAMVRGPAGEEIHTDRFGRFRAQFHWDREAQGTDKDSRWIRALQESATSMTLARVGWEMSVAYIDGDPDRPVGFARNINGVMPPAYGQPTNKNSMTIKTPSSPATGGYNELRLDDTAGSMLFSVRAEKDYAAEVKHDKTETIGHDETRDVGNDLTHAVGRDQTVSIGHDSKETIEKDRVLEIKGTRKKTVAASEKVDVGKDITLTTAKNETEEVGSLRFTFAGGFQMPDLVARAKDIAKGLVPNPQAIVQKAGDAAIAGAKSGAQKGAEKAFDDGGGLDGALENPGGTIGNVAGAAASGAASGAFDAAKGSLTESLKNMVPSPSGIASQLTGGLSEGITFGKLADQFLVGSIRRTATDKTTRLVGGAFISAGIGDIKLSAEKAYIETIGGLKLTVSVTAGIGQEVNGYMALTVGGAVVRSAIGDITVSADVTTVNVGAMLGFTSTKQIHLASKKIAITGLTKLDLSVSGAGILLDAGGAHLRGAVQVKAGDETVVLGKNNYLSA